MAIGGKLIQHHLPPYPPPPSAYHILFLYEIKVHIRLLLLNRRFVICRAAKQLIPYKLKRASTKCGHFKGEIKTEHFCHLRTLYKSFSRNPCVQVFSRSFKPTLKGTKFFIYLLIVTSCEILHSIVYFFCASFLIDAT